MTDPKLKVGIVAGSTQPGHKAEAVAQWVLDIANARGDAGVQQN